MRVAIAGAGHIAGIHAPAIAGCTGNEIVAVADDDAIRAECFARSRGIGRAFASAEEMISQTKPDVVHVLTPPAGHAELSIMALENGCHVYVEKPMAVTSEEARRMADAAVRNGRRLCVNHNMLFEPAIRKAIDMAVSGKLGKIISADVKLVFDPRRMAAYLEDGAEFSHWIYKLNGGPLEDLMPHPMSIMLELLGDIHEVKSVSRRQGILPGDWNDEIRVVLISADAAGSISVSLNEKPDVMLVTINGSKARVTADPFTGMVALHRSSCLPRAAQRGLSGFQAGGQYLAGSVANIFRFLSGRIDKSNGIAPLIRKFYDALSSGGEMPVSVEQGRRCVELVESIWPSRQAPEHRAIAAPVFSAAGAGPICLVTGGTGFVGSHLVSALLSRGKRVRVLVRKNSLHTGRLKALDVDVHEGDLRDTASVRRAVRGADYIYHAGAAMSSDWDEQERVTIEGTRNVVRAAVEQNVRKLLHVSSLVVYELLDLKRGSLIREDAPYQKDPRRMGPYAYSKVAAEKEVLDAANGGLDATIVRPGIVIGPRGRVFYPHLGYRLGGDVFIPVGSGRTVLPFVYVENLVDGIIKAAESDKTAGRSYNLVDEGSVSVNEFLDLYIKTTGSSAKVFHMPYCAAWMLTLAYEAAAAMRLVPRGITSRAQLRWKQADVRYDTSAAKADFGWESQVPLVEGIERAFRWHVQRYGA